MMIIDYRQGLMIVQVDLKLTGVHLPPSFGFLSFFKHLFINLNAYARVYKNYLKGLFLIVHSVVPRNETWAISMEVGTSHQPR